MTKKELLDHIEIEMGVQSDGMAMAQMDIDFPKYTPGIFHYDPKESLKFHHEKWEAWKQIYDIVEKCEIN